MEEVKILIADDHPEMRNSIMSIFSDLSDYVVVGDAENGRQILKSLPSLKPDVVIMDIKFPDIDGIDVVKQITQEFPETKVIMFSMYDSVKRALSSYQAGAAAYVIKGSGVDELLLAVDKVMAGKRYACQPIAEKLSRFGYKVENDREMAPFESLNLREQRILKLVSKGDTNREIAEKLKIPVSAVKRHIDMIMEKLDAKE